MSACASGCMTLGQHVADCEDDACRGCLPLPADAPALVCGRCSGQLELSLIRIPDLVAHIRTMVEPGAAPESSGAKHTKASEAPAPLNVAAMADADDLVALVAEQVEAVMLGRRLNGPDFDGCDIRPAAKRRTAWGEVVYEPARIVGLRGHGGCSGLVRWLLPHLGWLLAQEGAEAVVEGICKAERSASKRWPTQERPRVLPTPCPACDRLELVRYAPTDPGAPVRIACESPTCRHVISEDYFIRKAESEMQARRPRRSA